MQNIESEETKFSTERNITFKKPDNVSDNPSILPYPSNVGAPQIIPDDVHSWRQKNVISLNHQYQTEFQEIKSKYEQLLLDYEWNSLIYKSNFNFEPIVGQVYHLYKKENGTLILSLIGPNEWNLNFLGSFTLTSTFRWKKIN